MTTDYRHEALALIDWFKDKKIDPDNAVSVCIIVATLLEKTNKANMRKAFVNASKSLQGSGCAGYR